MSDIAKWALLAIGAVVIITTILALPFVEAIDLNELAWNITQIVNIAAEYLTIAKRFLNNFFTPIGRDILSAVICYILGKWFLTIGIKILSSAYHFIFRG